MTFRTDVLVAILAVSSAIPLGAQEPDSLRADVTTTRPSRALYDPAAYSGPPMSGLVAEHLGQIRTSFDDTPDGRSLLDVGLEEAAIASRHVHLAGQDSTDLVAMAGHMAHVLHAVDPMLAQSGPGLGYGVRRAARNIRTYADLALEVPEAPASVLDHLPHVAAAAAATLDRADQVVAMAQRIQGATNPRAAHRLVQRLAGLVRAMAYGADDDGDGRIGVPESEYGLMQVGYRFGMIERIEAQR